MPLHTHPRLPAMTPTYKAIFLACAAAIISTAATVMVYAATSFVVQPNEPQNAIYTTGIDLHDGTILKSGSTYYMYGTMYGCGFQWSKASPWCGYGVSTAPSLNGPWTAPARLFSPSAKSPFRNLTWQQLCGDSGSGCFNPRMIVRTWGPKDNVPILWFNAPADFVAGKTSAYYAMGCNSLKGPCGVEAGPPYGSTRKPPMTKCIANGDFSIITPANSQPYIFCTMAGSAGISLEKLDTWGTSGTGIGSQNIAGLKNIEAPGVYQDTATGKWIMTYSDPNCGYCAGNATSYATASSVEGPWVAPVNTGVNPDIKGRRAISASSCGGQPRTIFEVDGQAYQYIDLWGSWNGSVLNQAKAGQIYIPLKYTPRANAIGGVSYPQFAQWPCA